MEWDCDPAVGLRHLYSTVPQRYPDDVNFNDSQTNPISWQLRRAIHGGPDLGEGCEMNSELTGV